MPSLFMMLIIPSVPQIASNPPISQVSNSYPCQTFFFSFSPDCKTHNFSLLSLLDPQPVLQSLFEQCGVPRWHRHSQFCLITWTGEAQKPPWEVTRKVSLLDTCRAPASVQEDWKMSRFHTKTHLSQDDLPRNHPFKNNRCCGYEKPLTLLGSEQSGLCVPRDSRRRSKSSSFQCLFTQMDLGAAEDTVPLLDPPPTWWFPTQYYMDILNMFCHSQEPAAVIKAAPYPWGTVAGGLVLLGFQTSGFDLHLEPFSDVQNGILDLGMPTNILRSLQHRAAPLCKTIGEFDFVHQRFKYRHIFK